MTILGIDPGYATLGYGVIKYKNGNLKEINHGIISTSSSTAFSKRLEIIYDSLKKVLYSHKIESVAIEKLYFQNNQKTAIDVSQARGVAILASQKANTTIYEYTPLQVKMSVTGSGKAPKLQVMNMVKKLLSLQKIPTPDDAADSLAIAICHAHAIGFSKLNLNKSL
ncbi:MAG: crossover junction endodeoxyribonuclease RuvC [Oscillospiraceae bacterium]|jgi:crossover junction endodeoxyribonuclease RuvC|nr:crossover junction endodeoxyribonuclease RuvC [Oscillospiraceae bacterium]